MYQMTPPQAPMQKRERLNVLQILLILVVVVLGLWYLITTLMPVASPYGTIQAGTLGARYSGDCLLVRDETPYAAESVASIDYIAGEGALVRRGNAICNVYSSGYSAKEMTALQTYRDEIKDYQVRQLATETTYDARMAQLETDVLDRAREFRAMIFGHRGNLLNQETMLSTAVEARQQYLRRKYVNDQRLSGYYDNEQNQLQKINSWTKQYVASGESLVSFYCDGYEYGLTAENYATYDPSAVRRMISGQKPEQTTVQKGKTTIFRTVKDGSWIVLFLTRDINWNPVEGQSYELKLGGMESTHVTGTVLSFTRSGGELLVRLQVNAPVSPVLYMRTCTGEVGDYVQSLMVPNRAIYVQDNMNGVVVLDGQNKLFIPVNILHQSGNETYIAPIQQGLLYEGQTILLF